MKLKVRDSKNTIELSEVFESEFNEALVHQVLVAYQANARQGTKKQKNRSEVAGGGAKPWKQKGTGRARAGTRSSPIWRSGGVTFAARTNRNHSKSVPKKMYRGAMRSIISELLRKELLQVVQSFQIEQPKTKDFVAKLKEFDIANKQRVLILLEGFDANTFLSSRNLPNVEVLPVAMVNPETLLNCDCAIVTVAAMNKILEIVQ